MEKIISLAKRRGFIFPSSEIYGGFGSCYDFGPLGVEMKRNIKQEWWKEMTQSQDNIVGLDASILMSPKIWEASGHLTAGFADELVECKNCHKRFRLDELENQKSEITVAFGDSKKNQLPNCLECGGEMTKPRKFNLMMKTFVGSVEDESQATYLRAETCQGIYVNFKNVLQTMRLKLPFGIAQIGKAFRNEITTKNFIFRTREFEQMEMQFFVNPLINKKPQINTDKKQINADNKGRWRPEDWFDYWKEKRFQWYLNLGIKKENLRMREVPEKDRAHYAKQQVDIEYKFPFGLSRGEAGWQEIEGVHNRGDWDLGRHQEFSGQDLSYFDEATKEKYIPHIVETSVGVERSLLAFLVEAYTEVKGGRTKTTEATKEIEVILKLHKKLAPVKVAVLPLVRNKPELVKKAKEIYQILKPHFACQYDELGSIGRRYRRQDETATIFAVTVDFETLKKDDATVRWRDTMKQERVKIKDLTTFLQKALS